MLSLCVVRRFKTRAMLRREALEEAISTVEKLAQGKGGEAAAALLEAARTLRGLRWGKLPELLINGAKQQASNRT